MTEAIFPLLGAAFVVLVVLPACALLVKAGLAAFERGTAGGPLQRLDGRYVLLISSSALPLAWLLSAGLHQAETGKSTLACLFDHGAAALCVEPGFFALILVVFVLVCSRHVWRKPPPLEGPGSDQARAVMARLDRLLHERPALAILRGRIIVTDEVGFSLATHGNFRPRVTVGSAFASRLSDDMFASALGHECEHVRSLDPLRYAVLHGALAVNPVGRWLLDAHAARWQAARESQCDRVAVIRGAAPLALADAIVRAARPSAREVVALGARDTAVLKFRVGMLLAYAEKAPVQHHQGPATSPLAVLLLLVALLLPHQAGTAALDLLHTSVEHALTYFWR